MAKNHLRIATKTSLLAMRQAEVVKDLLETKFPTLNIEIIGISTKGDKLLHRTLPNIKGKSLFVKEIEQCLLDHEADLAIHPMKDVPAELRDGLCIPVILKRDDHRDVWVSKKYPDFYNVANGAIVGISSLRRKLQLLRLNPNLRTLTLRGNVTSRLDKLERGDFDAVILAAADLDLLQMHDKINKIFSIDEMLPIVGQGALGLECREGDSEVKDIISTLHHYETSVCVRCERAMHMVLGGNSNAPITGYARWTDDKIQITGLVASVDGKQFLTSTISGIPENNIALGKEVARQLIEQGAKTLIDDALHKPH